MEVAPVGWRFSPGPWGKIRGQVVFCSFKDLRQLATLYKHAAIECMCACPWECDVCVCAAFVCECVCVYSYTCLHLGVVWALASWDISLKTVSTILPTRRLFYDFLLLYSLAVPWHWAFTAVVLVYFSLSVVELQCVAIKSEWLKEWFVFMMSIFCCHSPGFLPFYVTLDFASGLLLKTNVNISIMTSDLPYCLKHYVALKLTIGICPYKSCKLLKIYIFYVC